MAIYRINQTNRDKYVLKEALKQHSHTSKNQPENYKNRVVIKPWGYEFLIFENEHVAIWFLKINYEHSTSMHCHPLKKTALSILKGEALCSGFENRLSMFSGNGLMIEKGAFHATKALTGGGVQLMEMETPPNKTDLVRMKDFYGRERRGYENLSEMEENQLTQFNHFYLEEPSGPIGEQYRSLQFELKIGTFSNSKEFYDSMGIVENSLFNICRGQIISNCVLLADVGDVIDTEALRNKELEFKDKTTILTYTRLCI